MAPPATINRSTVPTPALQRLSTFRDKDHSPETASLSTSLASFSSDPIFSPFLSPDFDPVRFSSQALSTGSAASTAEKLQDGIKLLEKQLRSDVLSRHSDLLSQLTSLRDAESALSLVRSSVSSLQSTGRRIRSEIADPNRQIRTKTTQLANIHETSELLQSTIRILRLSRKLRESIFASESDPERLDLLKAAQLHCEILSLAGDNGLSGIDVVDEELRWVSDVGARLRSEGMKVLEGGLESLNQADVGSGLQVFYNLGELRATVDGLISKYKSIGVKSISAALDMKAISAASGGGSSGGFVPGGVQRSGTPQLGASLKAKEALWQRLGTCIDQLHSIVVAVWHLQRVLSKKRDPFTHVLLLDEVIQDGDLMLTDRIWEAFVKSFATQMKSAFTASSFVKETFTAGYPKLYSMIVNLLERISRDTDVKGVLPAISSDGKHQMLGAIAIFQTAFLALCLGRLSDLVNNVFSMSGRVPSKENISKIVLRIQEEIEAVQFDERLTLLVLHEIEKVLHLLAQRAEYLISTGPEARQVMGAATPSQLKNFALCQHLQEVHTRMSSLLNNLTPRAAEVLSPALGAIHGIACDSVTSLFQAMHERLESCILQIHDRNSGVESVNDSDADASPYMLELRKCIIHFRSEFLSRLLPSFTSANKASSAAGAETICTKLVRQMASRVLMFFVRHASLVRPLSESGKIKMVKDMTELEVVVGQNMFPVEQLGAPYRALRALRNVVFLDTSQLESYIQDLPPSVILHHLYSRGPDELESPLQRNRLSPHQYSLWLDSQGEDQVWKGIKATLDDYAARVRARGDKEFSPVYPVMQRLGSMISSDNASMPRNL